MSKERFKKPTIRDRSLSKGEFKENDIEKMVLKANKTEEEMAEENESIFPWKEIKRGEIHRFTLRWDKQYHIISEYVFKEKGDPSIQQFLQRILIKGLKREANIILKKKGIKTRL